MNMPVINKRIKEKIRDFVLSEFGGKACQVVVGGAPLNKEIESFLTNIGFPIAMAYGTTETAPFITFANAEEYVPGELVCKGICVMQGYYKNQEATDAVIDQDGWFHTGDLATMSEDGHFYVKGRSKNMLLGPNGQNIYPEEIEDKLNSMAMVNESIVLQKGDPGRFREHYGTEPQGTERTNTNICQVVAHSVARPGIRENSKEIN